MDNEIAKIVTGVLSEKDLHNIKIRGIKEGVTDGFITLFTAIPCVGSIVAKAPEIYRGYRENVFFRKFASVVLGVQDLEHDKLVSFLKEVQNLANDYSGNVLMEIIDRLDNVNKGRVLANLISARASNDITTEDFFRLSTMLERIPFADLGKLVDYQPPYYDSTGVTELLYASGALYISIIDPQDGDKYSLSPLGVKLLKFGLRLCESVVDNKNGNKYEYLGKR